MKNASPGVREEAAVEDRLSRLESKVEGLSRALARVEARIASLETARGGASAPAAAALSEAPSTAAPTDSEISSGVALVGRTLLVLGGGYLLRALTESGAVPPLAGVALGLSYALGWLLIADRAGARGRTLSAAFHGGAAVLVAFPLLWEATARFQVLSPPWAAAALGVVSAVAVSIAWRRELRSFSGVTLVGATLTAIALLAGTRDLFSFSLLIVLVGVAALWLAYHAEWPVIHWIAAGVADLTVVLLTVGALVGRTNVRPGAAFLVPLALFALYLGTILHRVLGRRRDPGPFELAQGAFVTLVGYGGALWTAPGSVAVLLGILGSIAAVVCYAFSFQARERSVLSRTYIEGVGFLLLLLGSIALGVAPALFLTIGAVGLTWLVSKFERPLVTLHGAGFVLAASISSGLLVHGAYAFFAPAEYAWPPVGAWLIVSLVGAGLAYAVATGGGDQPWFVRFRLARLIELSIGVFGLGGLVLVAVVPWTSGSPGDGADAAILATVRTAVLGASAVTLGLLGRLERFVEASWLVYPLLVVGGIKLAVEDFPRGRTVTLFLGLAIYGAALILASRAVRSKAG